MWSVGRSIYLFAKHFNVPINKLINLFVIIVVVVINSADFHTVVFFFFCFLMFIIIINAITNTINKNVEKGMRKDNKNYKTTHVYYVYL